MARTGGHPSLVPWRARLPGEARPACATLWLQQPAAALLCIAAAVLALCACQPASSGARPTTAPSLVPTVVVRPSATAGPSPTVTSSPSPTFPADAVVGVASLNLRAGPDVLHPIVDVLATGTAVAVVGRSHDSTWLAVQSADLADGWINARYVELRRDLGAVPTRITPTPPATRTPTPVPADPAQPLVLSPSAVAQGDPLLVRLRAPGAGQVVAALWQSTVPLFAVPGADGVFAGMLPLPMDLPPGDYPVHVTAIDDGGDPVDRTATLTVRAAPFQEESISLDEKTSELLDPAQSAAETERLRSLVWSKVTAQRLWQGAWQRPITVSVSSGFGGVRAYNGGPPEERHTGVDLRAAQGSPVRAPAAGAVVMAEALVVRGNTVWLDHGWGVESGYFHLDAVRVAVGDLVKAGDVIGTVGMTGRTTGPHVHWEVRVVGVPVQPLEFLLRDVGQVP